MFIDHTELMPPAWLNAKKPTLGCWTIWSHFIEVCKNRTAEDALEPNLMDVIGALRGWPPMQPGATMTVHFDSKLEYEVTCRLKED
jgi:hypothetical protein